ncbi:hypothetical protein GW17_00002539 [Ensete ventricosum]|nr:hypothetical protein GW17_00002539 [Ensete ventricosum]RZS04526.1 hypothetical protein BHM03_00034870 [Ensete ventricosum]
MAMGERRTQRFRCGTTEESVFSLFSTLSINIVSLFKPYSLQTAKLQALAMTAQYTFECLETSRLFSDLTNENLMEEPGRNLTLSKSQNSSKWNTQLNLSSCCMCHTVTSLFHDLGVNATIHELDKDPRGREMERALTKLVGRNPPVPVVFIGGKLVGSTDRIMSLHLGGKLVPLLREAGALWV